MKNSKIFSRIKRITFSLGIIILLSCAWGGDDSFMSYFQPESSIDDITFNDYHFSSSFVYGADEGFYSSYQNPDSSHEELDENLASWQKYIGNSATIRQIADVVYDASDSLKKIYRKILLSKNNEKSNSPFINLLHEKPKAAEYLAYAWDVEAVQRRSTNWDEESTPANTDGLAKVLPIALKRSKNETDPFLKERYAFQAIKISCEMRNFDDAFKLYDTYFANKTSATPMNYWAESRIGGAKLILADTAEAIYHFAQVFEHSSAKRHPAYLSMRINEVKFDPEALKFCKTEKEKSAVYALCAIQPWQESIDIIKGMMKADPQDSLIRLVFAREINKAEYQLFSAEEFWREPWERDSILAAKRKDGSDGIRGLRGIAAKATQDPAIPDHAFWFTAAAHLAYLDNDIERSHVLLLEAEKIGSTKPIVQEQIALQKFLLFAERTPRMTAQAEDELMPMLERFAGRDNFRFTNAFIHASSIIEKKYKQLYPAPLKGGFLGCAPDKNTSSEKTSEQNTSAALQKDYAEAKSFIFHLFASGRGARPPQTQFKQIDYNSGNDMSLMNDTTTSHTVAAAIEYFSLTDAKPYDKKLQYLSGLTVDPLYRMLGTRSLAEHKYAEARDAFSHIDTAIWNKDPYTNYLAANPFATGIRDSHAPGESDTVKYTPLTFAKKMAALREKVKTNPDAQSYYELGCGSYNMSSWGNSWLLLKDSWTGYDELSEYEYSHDSFPRDSANYWAIAHAEKYFTEAMRLATDKELAARACFMAAKAEQKRFYIYRIERYAKFKDGLHRDDYGTSKADVIDTILINEQHDKFREYFKILLRDYPNTKFNDAALNECAYYKDYAKGMGK